MCTTVRATSLFHNTGAYSTASYPTATKTSACATTTSPGWLRKRPTRPKNWSSNARDTTPAAWKVSTTGSPVAAIRLRSAWQLSGWAPRIPTNSAGRCAPRINSLAWPIAVVGAAANGEIGNRAVASAVVGAASTSAGNTTAAAPRDSLTAARNAPTVASATLSGSLTSPVNLVTALSRAAASIDWWGRLGRVLR